MKAVPVTVGKLRGLRSPSFAVASIAEALRAHATALTDTAGEVLKHDARSLISAADVGGTRIVVKEVLKGGVRRRAADAFRGSAGMRAWRACDALAACGIRCATPLAILEQRSLGVPRRSLLLSIDLRPAPTAAALAASGPAAADRALDALCALAIRLHRHGFIHGDLRAKHVYLTQAGTRAQEHEEAIEATLIDLEGLSRRTLLKDEQRLRALAELNASLPDDVASPEARRRVFQDYANELPFQCGDDAALARLVHLSRERNHHWRGENCRLSDARS